MDYMNNIVSLEGVHFLSYNSILLLSSILKYLYLHTFYNVTSSKELYNQREQYKIN